ncbi:MAG: lipid A export permease/ATP-binding protein MsbA [Gammaproteobacteria bacterium]|nr:lipid A export permease/ATP-binding protein MsbA [Gammaproteobacteria bacterium]MDH5593031.1 lipid A export permease/ATP-binding protein MsbA [Gammaproteobacteria bacterium]
MTNQTESGLKVYRRLLSYSVSYWHLFAVAITGMVVVAATEPAFAALFQPLVDGSFVEKDPDVIKTMPLMILGIFILRGVASFISTYYMHWIGRQVIKQLRSRIFDHMLYLPSSYYDHSSSGRMLSRMSFDVEQVANAATTSLTVLIRDSLTILGLLAWMFYLSSVLSLIFLVVGPIIAILIAYVSKRFRRLSSRIQYSIGGVTQIAQEAIDGYKVVKIFGGQKHEKNQFEKINEYNRKQYMKLVKTNAISSPVVQFIGASGLSIIIYLSTLESMLSTFTPGTFISYVMAMVMLMPPIKRLTSINSAIQQGIAAGESIFGFLDEKQEQDTGTKEIDIARGEIEYRDVSFSYANSNRKALNKINLKIDPGQTVAFVGQSGSGKTTLVNLLPRFYSDYEGVIALDGYNAHEITLASLRKQISLVSQEVTLFNDTVANNIAYGLDEPDMEAIISAARVAHALEFIEKMPEGMDTMVGEDGLLLSGGQRQRIAIARAILKNAPVLILDEATSALDTESERFIQSALDELMKNRTTLVIAHRLSTIEKADMIVVMHDGEIVETGCHDELLSRQGYYTNLYNMQFKD